MLAVSVGLVGCGGGQLSPSLAIASTSGGNVSVLKDGAASWTEVQVGASLAPGDIIRSGDNSSAEITFLDGSTIELEAGTEVEVVSLKIATETGSSTIKLKQTIGSLIFRVTKIVDPASQYEVETPAGVVAIRGSAVRITVIEDGTTYVTNLEGDIWVVAQGVELQVPEGRQCIIKPGQPPELAVEVPDPNLEAVIRAAINKSTGDIYPSDLEGLTSLAGEEENITDLTGLEHATDLTYLDFGFNQISDISAVTSLTHLTYLDLTDNQISDISSVATITSLQQLYLTGNPISDISSLANLTDLRSLMLSGTQISDISTLANLTGLTQLGIGSNELNDISSLTNLTNLVLLAIVRSPISDISALASLTNLRQLYLLNDQISNISVLANFTNLTDLLLPGNQVSDISALVENQGLGAGDTIDMHNNPLSSDSINTYIPQLEARGVTVNY